MRNTFKLPVLFAETSGGSMDAGNINQTGAILVMGNEGNGFPQSVKQPGDKSLTICINKDRAESLNVSVAGGILMNYIKSL